MFASMLEIPTTNTIELALEIDENEWTCDIESML